jgi:putative ABC transport system permease protein
MPITDARKLLGSDPSGSNVLYLRLTDPSLQVRVKSQIGSELPGMSVTSSNSFLELMGGVSKISGQFALITSLIALVGAIALIIKTMLANLVARSSEIGVLKSVGWTGKDIRKQLMGEALLQSLAGGLIGVLIGYSFAHLLGFISIPASTPWQMNLLPAFAKNTEIATSTAVRLPVSVSASLVAASLAISLATGVLASYFMGKRTARMKPADILRRL